jgi:hypothetical protein
VEENTVTCISLRPDDIHIYLYQSMQIPSLQLRRSELALLHRNQTWGLHFVAKLRNIATNGIEVTWRQNLHKLEVLQLTIINGTPSTFLQWQQIVSLKFFKY